ncbi:hypothetical protein VOM14_01385 [Paraburkholderia sp. MPAMCS5]|uniref:hypothetical protein n=1 Tax=Paraburkholderia sp. MPAMCS5 TaxID=3112563 RepID=UPI002E1889E2|nr:hypothetical protein [Paraburkholderia sp. MPAMCS5]
MNPRHTFAAEVQISSVSARLRFRFVTPRNLPAEDEAAMADMTKSRNRHHHEWPAPLWFNSRSTRIANVFSQAENDT